MKLSPDSRMSNAENIGNSSQYRLMKCFGIEANITQDGEKFVISNELKDGATEGGQKVECVLSKVEKMDKFIFDGFQIESMSVNGVDMIVDGIRIFIAPNADFKVNEDPVMGGFASADVKRKIITLSRIEKADDLIVYMHEKNHLAGKVKNGPTEGFAINAIASLRGLDEGAGLADRLFHSIVNLLDNKVQPKLIRRYVGEELRADKGVLDELDGLRKMGHDFFPNDVGLYRVKNYLTVQMMNAANIDRIGFAKTELNKNELIHFENYD